MNFNKVKDYIEHMIEMAKYEDNPMYYISAKGCINGVLALCDSKELLTQSEIDYLIQTQNKLTHILLVYTLKGLTNE